MKAIFFALFSLCCFVANAQQTTQRDTLEKLQIVEAACVQCKFGLDGDDCTLAVRIDGKAWFVEGTDIDDHGDAHAPDGFCNAIRKAEVRGKLVGDKFKVSYFRLVVPEKKDPLLP